MNTPTRSRWAGAVVLASVLLAAETLTGCAGSSTSANVDPQTKVDAASTPSRTFSHPGRIDNRYLPITKTKRCELRGTANDGTIEKSVKTVLPQRKAFEVDGKRVEAVVVRDNAYEDGKLIESTLDYFAQSDEGTVYYLGEQVKNIESGEVVNTDGTWLYGQDTDRLGVAMPPAPKVGQQWHLEDVPGLTTESNRVEETHLRTKVLGRLMTDVIRVQEFIQPEGEVEYKLYAAGVGTVAEYPPDARVFLVGCR